MTRVESAPCFVLVLSSYRVLLWAGAGICSKSLTLQVFVRLKDRRPAKGSRAGKQAPVSASGALVSLGCAGPLITSVVVLPAGSKHLSNNDDNDFVEASFQHMLVANNAQAAKISDQRCTARNVAPLSDWTVPWRI